MAKVLVVEDDNNLREIYETSLKAEGYDTSSAADGMEALEIAGRDKPDLIISDVMMPRLSGFEMLEKLRQDQALKDIPVIMMTALSMAEDKDTAKRLGVVHYLVKSQVTLEDFVNVAKKFVPTEGGVPAAGPAPEAPAPSSEAPAASPPAEEKPAETPVSPPTEPPKTEPASAPEPAAPAAPEAPATPPTTTEPPKADAAQTTNDETNAVEAQIQSFVDSSAADSTTPQSAAPEPAAPAAENPVASPDAPAEEASKADKKVIQPIVDPNKKDINELAKAEDAKTHADEPVKNPSAGSSVDPNSIAL